MSESLTASPVFHALGLTLVHFIWQGAAIALLTAGTLALLTRASASLRYIVACVGLLSMVLTPAMTGFVVTQLPPASVPVFLTGGTVVPAPIPDAIAGAHHAPGFLDSTWIVVERQLPLIVLAWALCVLALSARLVFGWLNAERIRRGALRMVPEVVQSAVIRIARELGLARTPEVAESAQVEVPAVIGWLRPLILLPASALGQLSPWQLEAILAHEIAHVRRHDYLVNVLQCLLETLFFYHPAVWWLSSRVRAEREHCCDDVAVAMCGDRLNYARALTTLEASRHGGLALGVAATGGPLLVRVRRLLGQPEPTSRPISAAVVAITLVLIVAARAAGYSAAFHPQRPGPSSDAVVEAASQTGPSAPDRSKGNPTGDAAQSVLRLRAVSPVDSMRAVQPEAPVAAPQQVEQNPVAQLREVLNALGRMAESGAGPGQQVRSPEESAVLAAEEGLRLARLRGDAAALDRLLHNSSIDTRQNGATYDKRGEIVLFSRRFLTSLTIGPSTINVQGDTATVSGSQVEVSASGADVVLFTRTWTRESGGPWTMLSGSQFKDPRASAARTSPAPNARVTETVNVGGQPQAVAPAPPPPPLPGGVVRVGGDIKEPKKIRDVRPVYPRLAQASQVQGLVILETTIDKEGNVANARVLRSVPMLDQAALDAVLQWKYVPPTLNGEPVSVLMTVTVNFILPPDTTGASVLPGGVIQTGNETTAPIKIRDVRPAYPADARAAGVQGIVIVSATIDQLGNVTDARLLRSVPMLDEAALDAVKQWRYLPARTNGEPVAVEMTLTVNFTLPANQ